MSEKISRKEALKRIALVGGAAIGAGVVGSSCMPIATQYCNSYYYCEDYTTSSSYCNYTNDSWYCQGYNYYYYGYDNYYYCYGYCDHA